MEFLNEKNEVYYTLRWWKNSKLTLLYKAYLFYILSHLAVKVTWVSQLFDQETKFQSETCYHTGDIRFSCTSRTECKPKVVKCKVVFSPTICVLLKIKAKIFLFQTIFVLLVSHSFRMNEIWSLQHREHLSLFVSLASSISLSKFSSFSDNWFRYWNICSET